MAVTSGLSRDDATSLARPVAEALYATVVLLLALHFAALRAASTYELETATLLRLVEGTAHTPFQYRILTPWLIGTLADLLHLERSEADLARLLRGVEAGALAALVYVCRWLLMAVTGSRAVSLLLPLSLFLTLPFNLVLSRFNNFQMAYDLPGILFFALGMLFIHRRRYAAFYATFVLAVLNRETAGFLTLLYLFTQWRAVPRRELAAHVVAQAAIWLLLKVGLFLIFSDNRGAALLELLHHDTQGNAGSEIHLWTNLLAVTTPHFWPHMISAFGYMWIPLIVFRNRVADDFARRSLYVLAPFLGFSMVVANIFELRIFGDFYPVLLLALGSIAAEFQRWSSEVQPRGPVQDKDSR